MRQFCFCALAYCDDYGYLFDFNSSFRAMVHKRNSNLARGRLRTSCEDALFGDNVRIRIGQAGPGGGRTRAPGVGVSAAGPGRAAVRGPLLQTEPSEQGRVSALCWDYSSGVGLCSEWMCVSSSPYCGESPWGRKYVFSSVLCTGCFGCTQIRPNSNLLTHESPRPR